jgi:hypothetical protein
VVEQVEGSQLAIFFVGAPNGLLKFLQDAANKEKISQVCLVKSIQDISTEDIIRLTENKVPEQNGSVVTTSNLQDPTGSGGIFQLFRRRSNTVEVSETANVS